MPSPQHRGATYESSGVASLDQRPGFRGLLSHLKETFSLRADAGRPLLDFGYFASVLDLGGPLALAISTDGIGTKAIVAQLVDRYDTVGIDCVAMNANDILCVGAEPIAMTDYIAVEVADDGLLDEIGKGLLEGARQANISIPGGEISQVREIIRSERPGRGFDLLGTCVGLVEPTAVLTGEGIEEGDAIIGLASSGIHSNGLTLARKTLLEDGSHRIDEHVPDLGRSIGEELLEPTRIYVPAVLPMLRERLPIKALCHLTSEGYLNLARVKANAGFVIDSLPGPPPIFGMIQEVGQIESAEMYRVFNMGVGFCVIVSPEAVTRVKQIAEERGVPAWTLGHCIEDAEKRVWVNPVNLVGKNGQFVRA